MNKTKILNWLCKKHDNKYLAFSTIEIMWIVGWSGIIILTRRFPTNMFLVEGIIYTIGLLFIAFKVKQFHEKHDTVVK
jgi:CHASE2 domain-containing sensor protein